MKRSSVLDSVSVISLFCLSSCRATLARGPVVEDKECDFFWVSDSFTLSSSTSEAAMLSSWSELSVRFSAYPNSRAQHLSRIVAPYSSVSASSIFCAVALAVGSPKESSFAKLSTLTSSFFDWAIASLMSSSTRL